MTKSNKNRYDLNRPPPPDTPHVCAGCRFGLLMLHKFQTCDEESTCWDTDKFRWQWIARCNNPRIVGSTPEIFWSPVVDCEGFEARAFAPSKKRGKKTREKNGKKPKKARND